MIVRLRRGQTDSWATNQSPTMTDLPGDRPAAPSHGSATVRAGAAPFSETVADDARGGVRPTTPPRDQGQHRRAEKTTVRPPAGLPGVAENE
jgi:hypothetical protein